MGAWGLHSTCVSADSVMTLWGHGACLWVLVGLLFTRGRGRCTPPAHMWVLIGVSWGARPCGGQSSTCLGAGGDMEGQHSTCLGAIGVFEVSGEPWLSVPAGYQPSRYGREAGLPVALMFMCPSLSGPPPSFQDPEQVAGRLSGRCAALA